MVLAKVNEIQYMHFTIFQADGITPWSGQVGGCTEDLRKNGAATAEVVTLAEIGATGYYYASFTPLAVADYDLEVTCPDDRVMGENWETEVNDLDDLAADIATVDGKVDVIDGNVDLILLDTTQLLLDTASIEGKIDAMQIDVTSIENKIDIIDPIIDQIQLDTTQLLLDTASIEGKVDLIQTDVTQIIADVATVDGKVDSIQADTTQLLLDTIAILAALTTIDGKVDNIYIDTQQLLLDIAALNNITALDVWDVLLVNILTAGSIGLLLKTNIDATISSRASEANATTNTTNIIAEVDANEVKIDAILVDTLNILADLVSIEGKIDTLDTNVDTIITDMAKLLALNRENVVVESTFNTSHQHTGFIMYCYNSKTNAELNDHVTGLLYRYQLTVTYTGIDPDEIEMVLL